MKVRILIAAGAVLLLAGTAPALAQMMGPGGATSGKTEMMPGMPQGASECPGMAAAAFGGEPPGIRPFPALTPALRPAPARIGNNATAVLAAQQRACAASVAFSLRVMHAGTTGRP